MTRIIVRPLPVLYACQGCPEYGQRARDFAATQDRARLGEMVWLGAAGEITPSQRYPVYAVDGCRKGCALRWLAEHGIIAERSYVAE
jgi:uncharacterized metal-binding protein